MASIEDPGASRSEDSAVSADVGHGIEIHGADYDSGGDRLAVPQTSIGTKCNDEKRRGGNPEVLILIRDTQMGGGGGHPNRGVRARVVDESGSG